MIGGARSGVQQFKIGCNRSKPVVDLMFNEAPIFYRTLLSHVARGRAIRCAMPGWHKRLAVNSKEKMRRRSENVWTRPFNTTEDNKQN